MISAPKSKVLVVDDDPAILEMYKERLAAAGYEVVAAATAEDGLSRSLEGKPDIILLDIRLPRTNGLDMLDVLKTTDTTKAIPVILLTALTGPEVRERALARGADDFLIKSESMPGDVVKKIEQVLAKKSSQHGAG